MYYVARYPGYLRLTRTYDVKGTRYLAHTCESTYCDGHQDERACKERAALVRTYDYTSSYDRAMLHAHLGPLRYTYPVAL